MEQISQSAWVLHASMCYRWRSSPSMTSLSSVQVTSQSQLTGTHVWAQTSSKSQTLTIVVMNSRSQSHQTPAAGYLENAQQPGFGLREFTCRQLKEGNIYYVHKGGEVPELILQVSDGDSVSQSSTFKLLITQPQMTVVTNTGLLITQDDSTPIGIQNLAISATPKTGDVVYNVTQPLQFGELQLISDDGVPKRVTLFHQSDLEQNRLKYVPNPTADLKGTETEYSLQCTAWTGHPTRQLIYDRDHACPYRNS